MVKKFLYAAFRNNTHLFDHMVISGMFSWFMKHQEADPYLTMWIVLFAAFTNEIWQYMLKGKFFRKLNWSHAHKQSFLADSAGDIIGAIIVAFWILF